MPLVTSNQFQSRGIPDSLARGVKQGQTIRNNFTRQNELDGQIQRQNQFRQLTSDVLDPSLTADERFAAQRQRASVNPERAQKLDVGSVGLDKARDQQFLESVVKGAAQINSIPTPEGRLQAALRRKEELTRSNLPTDETDELIGFLQSGDNASAQAMLDEGVRLGQQAGILTGDNSVGNDLKQQEIDIKREALDIRRLENNARKGDQAILRETNQLKRDALILKNEETKNSITEKKNKLTTSNQQAFSKLDDGIATVDRLLSHKGLSDAVGFSSQLPSIAGTDRASFEAELESFDAKIFTNVVQTMKGLGSLSDAEGRKISAAAGAINPRMKEDDFKKSLNIIRDGFEKAKNWMKDNGYQAQNTQSDSEAVAWAKANPSDPRSIEIMKLQGSQ